MTSGWLNARIRLSVAALALLPAFLPAYQGPDEEDLHINLTQVDSSRFPIITAYVSVADQSGEPVGIDPARIVLSEDGVLIQPDQVMALGEVEALTTLLVFDVSGSMNKAGKLDLAKEAARAYVNQMGPGDQVGLLAFDTEVEYVQSITSDQGALLTAIDSLYGTRDTAMYDALVEAAEILSAHPGRKAIIGLTDGMDNSSQHALSDVIASIGPSGLSISTVGLGDPEQGNASWAGLDVAALERLAAQAGGEFALADNQAQVTSLYQRLARLLQSEYAIVYTSPSALRDGVTRQLSVSLADSSEISTQAKYNPGGLVPEVGRLTSWPSFLLGLGALSSLLFLPRLIERGFSALDATHRFGFMKHRRKPLIRFTDKQPDPHTRPR